METLANSQQSTYVILTGEALSTTDTHLNTLFLLCVDVAMFETATRGIQAIVQIRRDKASRSSEGSR